MLSLDLLLLAHDVSFFSITIDEHYKSHCDFIGESLPSSRLQISTLSLELLLPDDTSLLLITTDGHYRYAIVRVFMRAV